MAPLEATAEFRVSNPEGSTREQIASEAPHLRDLAEKFPDLLIYTPSAATFEEVRPFYNAAFTNQPGAIVRPRTDAEVAAVIQEAQAKSVPFGIRSGGHDLVAAQLQGKDGIMIDLRSLDSAVVAEDKKSARVGGGILGVNLSKFLHEHKLLTPHGWCATVGIVGWALGGGYGYSSAFYGLGVDQILGARVVLASGEVVDTDEHPDLLWALRGAGNGNFGVVVELRVKLYPETAYLGGLLGYPNAEAGKVLTQFSEFEKDLPVNFSGELTHMTIPGVGAVLAWVFAWTSEDDDLEEGWAFHQKLKTLGTPILDTVAAVTDYEFYSAFPNPSGNHIHPRVCTVEYLSPEVGNLIANNPPPGPMCANVIHSAHGRALQENPAACYPLRRRHRIVNPNAGVPDAGLQPAEFESYKKWNDGLVAELSAKGLTLPCGYRNLGPDKDVNWTALFGEETLAKLKDVKKKFDPENVFRTGFPRLDLI
ncbi:6-hydroxy-d-nicotine oxidase [Colletotrichum karsti]|uniref:6-hydroxy-d-nicotine oxidase n=1 Tax=Colletotrichum karsti TaxID=1095194 RepID=A0A9P6I8Y3_9PEZI|nr:6-hydroxy-d-nicotine oxidase [Colletotrichum karsti]KAF9878165.1 6-hydroxy-d-nicotine oxidase [Colletotrichum karsti]